jgi:hypothetical protein
LSAFKLRVTFQHQKAEGENAKSPLILPRETTSPERRAFARIEISRGGEARDQDVEECMTSGADLDRTNEGREGLHIGDRVRGALVIVGGAAVMVGLAVAAMSVITSPDSWVMKAANQTMLDQQAVATSYLMADN